MPLLSLGPPKKKVCEVGASLSRFAGHTVDFGTSEQFNPSNCENQALLDRDFPQFPQFASGAGGAHGPPRGRFWSKKQCYDAHGAYYMHI